MTDMPWRDGPDAAACDAAFEHLARNLRIRLMQGGRVHAETLVAASGAVAGFAAQRALLAGFAAAPDPDALRALRIVTTEAGNKFLLGDPLDGALVARRDGEARERVFSLAAGAAAGLGLPPDRFPDPDALFARAAAALGGADEGWPCVDPRHRPSLPTKALLDVVWPLAASIFEGRVPGRDGDYGVAPQRWRPAIAAWCTGVHIRDVASVLDPLVAYTLAVESAVHASKIDAGRVGTILR